MPKMQLTDSQREALAYLARNELCRRSYRDYVEIVHRGQYQHFRHTELICKELQPIAEGNNDLSLSKCPHDTVSL